MKSNRYMGTEEAGRRCGMSSEWIRRQIISGKLPAVVYRTGTRSVYRITEAGLAQFRRQFSGTIGPGSDGSFRDDDVGR